MSCRSELFFRIKVCSLESFCVFCLFTNCQNLPESGDAASACLIVHADNEACVGETSLSDTASIEAWPQLVAGHTNSRYCTLHGQVYIGIWLVGKVVKKINKTALCGLQYE